MTSAMMTLTNDQVQIARVRLEQGFMPRQAQGVEKKEPVLCPKSAPQNTRHTRRYQQGEST